MGLTRIAIDGMRPAEPPAGPRPELLLVPVARLVIDDSYQRPVTAAGRRAIRRIADGWDWSRFQPIVVAPSTGGCYAVIDGQHRAHAAALCGIAELPAMAVEVDKPAQAAAFAAINRDRIKPDGLSIYRAELAAGAEWAMAVRDAVAAGHCCMATSNPTATSKSPGYVYAIGLIRRMVTAGEAEAVSAGLRAIVKSDSGRLVSSYSGPVLSVWLPALARNQRFLRLDLAAVFDSIDFDDLLDTARVEARTRGGSARAIAENWVIERLNLARAAA